MAQYKHTGGSLPTDDFAYDRGASAGMPQQGYAQPPPYAQPQGYGQPQPQGGYQQGQPQPQGGYQQGYTNQAFPQSQAAQPQQQRARSEPQGVNYINRCVKYLLFFFNLLFWLVGGAAVGLGTWLFIEKDKDVRDVLDVAFDPTILLIIAGGIVFVIGFFGCTGALRENSCLLTTFWILMTIILILELLVGAFVFIYYFVPSVKEKVEFISLDKLPLDTAIIRYRDDDDLRNIIDTIQKAFKCCGHSNDENGYQNWQANVYFNCSDTNPSQERCAVPASCCVVEPGALINVMCGYDTTNKLAAEVKNQIYTQGCLLGFGTWLGQNIYIIGGCLLGVIIPQLVGICLARTLVGQISDQKSQWR